MKKSIMTAFAVLAIATSATFAQYFGVWSPVSVFDPAVSTNTDQQWDGTFTLVYRISATGDSFAWTPDVVDERADVCPDNEVKQAEILKLRETGYLFIKIQIDGGNYDREVGYSDSCTLPWSWVCASTGGVVNVIDMWMQLDTAKPWQTSDGPVPLMVDNYIMYAALEKAKYSLPSMPSYDWTPVWQPNFNWNMNWNDCRPTNDCLPSYEPCWDIDWDYVRPASAVVKIYGAIDPRDDNEWAVFDLISSSARQRPLNQIIGRECSTCQVFVPQTFKGGLITMGAPSVNQPFSAGFGTVTDWYNKWENCPEDIVMCLDLRLDAAMTQAHNACSYTPDEPGGGCAPGGGWGGNMSSYARGGFSLW